MFLRSVQPPRAYLPSAGENFPPRRQVKQRVILHLAGKILLARIWTSLVRSAHRRQPAPRWFSSQQVSTPQAWSWGRSWRLGIC